MKSDTASSKDINLTELEIGRVMRSEHLHEQCGEEAFCHLDRCLSFAADGVGFIEDVGDPLLLRQGRQGNLFSFYLSKYETANRRTDIF